MFGIEPVRECASTPGSAGATASRRAAAPTRTAASTSTPTRRYGSWFTYTARKPWHIVDVSGSAFKYGRRRQPRVQVRLRLPHATRTTRRRGGAASEVVGYINAPGDAYRAGVPRPRRQLHRRELRRVLRRHVQQGPLDGERRHPVGPADGRRTSASTAPANTAFPTLLPVADLRRRRTDDQLERHFATRRRHLRARREPQDGRPRSYARYAGSAQPVRGDGAQPGRRLLHVHRLQVGRHQRRRIRAEERDPDQPGAAILATTSIPRNPTQR